MRYERKKSEDYTIPDYALVDVTEAGKMTEIRYTTPRNRKATIKKLDAKHYLHLGSGEIKEYKEPSTNRAQSVKSFRKSLRKLMLLVQANVTDPRKVLWLTLTYARNEQDTKVVYKDFKYFMTLLRRYCTENGYSEPEYISVLEPQERGAWHLHCFIIWPDKAPFIDHSTLNRFWGHGFLKPKRLDNVDNIAGYLSAYLADVEISSESAQKYPENRVKEVTIDHQKKRFLKGGRISYYPSGTNFFRHSRNIKKAEKSEMRMREAKKLVAGKHLKYKQAGVLTDDNGFQLTLVTEEYR